ncbi:MAG: bis(5'-nucleosyl)-tetraphosphatase (symmetrical) YqeK [Firmicutes bacterium]|nr:bis(5'-nucleosyl)-tetraphosphatase (symmetrical) YqeK [Bacillota bacterium]
MDYIKKKISDYIEKNLSEKRRIHTEGVRKTAVMLAEKYGEDVDKAEVAALCHDMYRGINIDLLNDYVNQLGLDKKYLDNPNLAHGKIAAVMIKKEYGIDDQDIINAVSFHTTGRAGMSELEKIIYLADAIEPGRDYPSVNQLREAVDRGLDEALIMSLERTIEYVRQQGHFLDEDTLKARDYYLKEEKPINEQ